MKADSRLAVTLGVFAMFTGAIQPATALVAPPDCTRPVPEPCPGKDCAVDCEGDDCTKPDPDCGDDISHPMAADSAPAHDLEPQLEPEPHYHHSAVEPEPATFEDEEVDDKDVDVDP